MTAAGGDSSVMLTWDPVTTRMDGSKYEGFVGYNIYRGPEKGRLDEAPPEQRAGENDLVQRPCGGERQDVLLYRPQR